jgi:hypothetical protein
MWDERLWEEALRVLDDFAAGADSPGKSGAALFWKRTCGYSHNPGGHCANSPNAPSFGNMAARVRARPDELRCKMGLTSAAVVCGR